MTQNFRTASLLIAISLWTGGTSYAQVQGSGAPGKPPAPAATWDRAGQGAAQTAATLPEVDLRGLKIQLQVFQDLVNRSIQQSFEQPFTLLQDAKGSYLPHFGAVFQLEVNLHPMRLISPFDMRPYTPEELRKARDAKLQRVRELKTRLSALLLEHGTKLSEVPPDQGVAIVVHLFNLPSEQSEALPTQLVIETSRAVLLDAQAQRTTVAEFQKRGLFLEF